MGKGKIYLIKGINEGYGCGFFINGYFITAGHVIEELVEPYVIIDNVSYALNNHKYLSIGNDSTEFDIAIYNNILIPESNSFELYESHLEEGANLINHSFVQKQIVEKNSPNNGHFIYVPITTKATVECPSIDNYFSFYSTVNLKSGCSGSPLLIDNKVVGIIVAGNNKGDDTRIDESKPINYCVALSTKAILQILSRI